MFDLVVAEPRGRAIVEEASDALSCDLLSKARDADALFENAYAQPARYTRQMRKRFGSTSVLM